jgi:asparagine synthase (glutamine-hydrolysing)
MCGIAGWIDWHKNGLEHALIMEQMSNTMAMRGPDAAGIWLATHCALAHRRLSVMDPANGAQPMVFQRANTEQTYVLVYNGELYNAPELRQALQSRGYDFRTHCDTEVLLYACVEWGKEALERLNGIFAFAFWDEQAQTCWLARDRLGVKPLFFARMENGLLFASEIKALLAHPEVTSTVTAEGMAEIWGLGPARTPGFAVFREIEELRPGQWLEFSRRGCTQRTWWQLHTAPHVDDEAQTVARVRELLEQATARQLVSDVPIGTLLSGGLDSGALTALAARANQQESLQTFSVDYEEQAQYFTAHAFQPDRDGPFIDLLRAQWGTNHHAVELTNARLAETLSESMRARDLPGMADIDSSLLLFCREIKKKATVALSGEAADEIFGGYPWFHREALLQSDTFPWTRSLDLRRSVLNEDAQHELQLAQHVARRYEEALAEVPYLSSELHAGEERAKRLREISYLNISRFLPTLLDRKDRMSMACGLEVRVPFCDHELVEYVWNIPWHLKNLGGREKGILRNALQGLLPDDILWRPKSPYPKTHHPVYTQAVCNELRAVLHDRDAPLLRWIHPARVLQLIEQTERGDHGAASVPWFGQLMSGPQCLAYLLQVNRWLLEYRVRVV